MGQTEQTARAAALPTVAILVNAAAITGAWGRVLRHRANQYAHGYDAAHDDTHANGWIARLARATLEGTANPDVLRQLAMGGGDATNCALHIVEKWTDKRDVYAIVAALLVAEIERMDRVVKSTGEALLDAQTREAEALLAAVNPPKGYKPPEWHRDVTIQPKSEREWWVRYVDPTGIYWFLKPPAMFSHDPGTWVMDGGQIGMADFPTHSDAYKALLAATAPPPVSKPIPLTGTPLPDAVVDGKVNPAFVETIFPNGTAVGPDSPPPKYPDDYTERHARYPEPPPRGSVVGPEEFPGTDEHSHYDLSYIDKPAAKPERDMFPYVTPDPVDTVEAAGGPNGDDGKARHAPRHEELPPPT